MKYHLVRKNLTYLIGPLNEVKLRAYLVGEDVDLNDEIAGSCGKWVRLGDTGRLQKYYPHIHKFMDSRSKSWNMSIHSGTPTVLAKKTSWKSLALPVLAALFLVCAAIFLWNYKSVFDGNALPNQDPYNAAVKKYNINRFKSLVHDIDKELDSWKDLEVDQLVRRQNLWLPIIRSAAFASQALENRYKTILPEPTPLPSLGKCRREDIRQQIRSEGVGDMFEQPFSRDSSIAKLLLWDPQWVKRRKEQGWGKPQNRYEACLVRVKQALESLPPSTLQNQVLLRVNKMLQIIDSSFFKVSPSRYKSDEKVHSFFGVLSCIESANSKSTLVSCSTSGFEGDKLEYLKWRADMRLAWIGAMQGQFVQKYDHFFNQMQKITSLPHVYQPELRLLNELKTGSSLPKAIEAAEALDENFRL